MTVRAHPDDPLNPDEVNVLALLADGQSIAEIAAELGIGYDAVSSRLSCIRRKLRARHNPHAIVRAHRTGQLHLGPVRSAA
ncbi:helix-turn-helix transcriptional regulator [Kitasatospora sp. CM 4170]|uniref:Helix-turn-helix transcriptional regulator n=1 Tax=Kitasatospora aburaviensis TaxID=67265 RepID=A0ABW1F2F4_9ACTN|nr:helix-turn-helix transcriptional regulator [Kitasatospora sp. CM 4170]WNM45589.1 helix-turn-helix transcriptional regulator [Kitasatospora sp. CM 4170]